MVGWFHATFLNCCKLLFRQRFLASHPRHGNWFVWKLFPFCKYCRREKIKLPERVSLRNWSLIFLSRLEDVHKSFTGCMRDSSGYFVKKPATACKRLLYDGLCDIFVVNIRSINIFTPEWDFKISRKELFLLTTNSTRRLNYSSWKFCLIVDWWLRGHERQRGLIPLTLPLTSAHSRRKHFVAVVQTNFLDPEINPRSRRKEKFIENVWSESIAETKRLHIESLALRAISKWYLSLSAAVSRMIIFRESPSWHWKKYHAAVWSWFFKVQSAERK